jgi:plasmid stability protein
MVKATFELPEELIELLRARSEREARSVDAVAAEILQNGLEEEIAPASVQDLLGDLVAQPASGSFDAEAFRKAMADIDLRGLQGLDEDLEWTREDRF